MYGWGGDDVKNWKKPGAYNYDSARRGYLGKLSADAAAKGPRTYASRSRPDMKLVDPRGKTLETDCANPVVLCVDGTGSMQTWPAEIFDRLPLFYQTLSQYRPDVEISFSVIGDATSDQWPCQVGAFDKGVALDGILKALKPEGGGGGQHFESYELWAYFMAKQVKAPKAVSPMMIVMGDEAFYDQVDPAQAKEYLGLELQGPADANAVWKELGQRWDVYILRKEYAGLDEEIRTQWQNALGRQKVIPITDPQRCVDVAMGLIARKWGQFGDFTKNLSARQDADGIGTVMNSLRAAGTPVVGSKSLTKGAGGMRSKPLV
jgi:hypothetical protein